MTMTRAGAETLVCQFKHAAYLIGDYAGRNESDIERFENLLNTRARLQDQLIDALCTPNAAVEALQAVEWVSRVGSGGMFCPWCKGYYPDHKADCVRQTAIAAAEEG